MSVLPRRTCRRAAVMAMLPHASVGLRYAHTAKQYTSLRKHPGLFEPIGVDKWLDARFLDLLACTDRRGGQLDASHDDSIVAEVAPDVYSFPLLTDDACRALAEEVANFRSSGLEARRPNSMNNYGVVLNDIGFKSALDVLQALVAPVARALFPVEGQKFDDHHSFVVSYRPDQDKGLDMHTDDSDVTLNVCLGDVFTASGLTFCGTMGAADHRQVSACYQHVPGRAVLHLGRRRHGADDILSGHRVNLIMWNYNKGYRASAAYRRRSAAYLKEAAPPAVECTSFTHDRDYLQVRGSGLDAAARLRAAQRAPNTWCPPPALEYDGFKGVGGRYKAIDPAFQDLMD